MNNIKEVVLSLRINVVLKKKDKFSIAGHPTGKSGQRMTNSVLKHC